jgi:hypothetical protein
MMVCRFARGIVLESYYKISDTSPKCLSTSTDMYCRQIDVTTKHQWQSTYVGTTPLPKRARFPQLLTSPWQASTTWSNNLSTVYLGH